MCDSCDTKKDRLKATDETFKIKIEEDGTVTIVTGKFGAEIHKKAEEFLELMQEELGAERKKAPASKDRHNAHVSTHQHVRGK
jgi:hypothetical protein